MTLAPVSFQHPDDILPGVRRTAQVTARVPGSIVALLTLTVFSWAMALPVETVGTRFGGTTPVAGVVHALTIAAVVLLAAPLVIHVPLAVLAGILLFVAYNMGEWHEFARLKHQSSHYPLLMLGTFFLTVVCDLTVAVQAVESGPLHPVVVLDALHLVSLDTTGLDALRQLNKAVAAKGGSLRLESLQAQPREVIERSGFARELAVTPSPSGGGSKAAYCGEWATCPSHSLAPAGLALWPCAEHIGPHSCTP